MPLTESKSVKRINRRANSAAGSISHLSGRHGGRFCPSVEMGEALRERGGWALTTDRLMGCSAGRRADAFKNSGWLAKQAIRQFSRSRGEASERLEKGARSGWAKGNSPILTVAEWQVGAEPGRCGVSPLERVAAHEVAARERLFPSKESTTLGHPTALKNYVLHNKPDSVISYFPSP